MNSIKSSQELLHRIRRPRPEVRVNMTGLTGLLRKSCVDRERPEGNNNNKRKVNYSIYQDIKINQCVSTLEPGGLEKR